MLGRLRRDSEHQGLENLGPLQVQVEGEKRKSGHWILGTGGRGSERSASKSTGNDLFYQNFTLLQTPIVTSHILSVSPIGEASQKLEDEEAL